jgi:hypothetical protein
LSRGENQEDENQKLNVRKRCQLHKDKYRVLSITCGGYGKKETQGHERGLLRSWKKMGMRER